MSMNVFKNHMSLLPFSKSYDTISHEKFTEHLKCVQMNYCRHS